MTTARRTSADPRRRPGAWAIPLGLVLALAGPPAAAQEVRVSHLPPDEKDILEALILSAGVPLSVDPSCTGVGSDVDDRTLGRYLAGLLAAMAEPNPQNRIAVTVAPESGREGETWRGTVMVHAGDDVSPYVWGVEFLVRQADGLVLPSSFRCLGAG